MSKKPETFVCPMCGEPLLEISATIMACPDCKEEFEITYLRELEIKRKPFINTGKDEFGNDLTPEAIL